jgi:glutamate synthase domain-containing protein 2/glutamate synthase domain-containing protein 1/glutamate synthase domain-containing protein 3
MKTDKSKPEKQGLYDPKNEHDSCGVGFVCNIKGEKSNDIVKKGLKILNRLAHRGAVGADPKTGDGAGILIQLPHEFLSKVTEKEKIDLPSPGEYGTGIVFLPQDSHERSFFKEVLTKVIEEEKQFFLGWRKVPVNNSNIGTSARESQPSIEQIFIKANPDLLSKNKKDGLDFERILYVIRKRAENIICSSDIKQKSFFYITNISSRTISYKGLLMANQVEDFYIDLKDESIKSAIAMVHSRYSTNTFPTWDLAQPFRFLSHNGEINTLRGNINWMKAREGLLRSPLLGKDIEKIKPIIDVSKSDSAIIDNVFELLVLSGRALPHAMMMLIPAAWENNNLMDKKLKDFYKYHACISEPWDGPAAIAFTDGSRVGAILDRNGLRPARYLITKYGEAVMASEVGVLDIKGKDITKSGRLEPGKIFFIDTEKGEIIPDENIKDDLSSKRPYGSWLSEHLLKFDSVKSRKKMGKNSDCKKEDFLSCLKASGYTREDLKFILKPMATEGKEPIGSMGNDHPHAILSKQPQLIFNYFKQLFAQVTNPPIDSIREKIVMSMISFLGPKGNILEEIPTHAHKLELKEPILTNEEFKKLKNININGFASKTISLLFNPDNEKNFLKALDRITKEAKEAAENGYLFILLSDRGIDEKNVNLPSLIATGAVHHYLTNKELRTQVNILVECADAKEVQHFALLLGYGADCINPYLAFEVIKYLTKEGEITIDKDDAINNYKKAINKGILKILSKMGISTLQSYRGAQIFEALGLGKEVIDKCFSGTTSRIGGADLLTLAKESIIRHKEAFSDSPLEKNYLTSGGFFQWKRDGEYHLWNPQSIAYLQDSTRKGDYSEYKKFAQIINNQTENPTTLRSLLGFTSNRSPIPIKEVEPVSEIVKRFAIGAMSFGSISREAHETIAMAMNKLGGMSNTGEGGEDPSRFKRLSNGASFSSKVKQVASGRFGVTTNYLVHADEIQIKIAQGAKPGEGGHLPGHKVSEIIAKTRHTTPGVTLISPPPHHDIYSIEDLNQLIFDLRNVNPKARISVKLVSEVGVGTVAAGVAKGHADMILISGGDGGTGASPLSSIHHAGLPWELGLSETHQTLVLNNLRSRVRLQTDGQIRTGRDIAISAILGAEEYGFATAALIVLGCIMLRHCNLGNCSVGVATQNDILRKRFNGKVEYLVNYFNFVAEELREIMASLGIRRIEEMIGKTELLELNEKNLDWKSKNIDFSNILYKPEIKGNTGVFYSNPEKHDLDDILDVQLIDLARNALLKEEKVIQNIAINNTNRTVGARLSGEVCYIYGEKGLPDDTIHFKFKGSAGQSFAAFLTKGITFELEGMANDYVGKGFFGGKIIVYPDKKISYRPEENIIIGNTSFYGATGGEAYIRGIAGERFCIRNSGLNAVVEGVGDHGCEYMTGGRVVIIGRTGRNFAAGMSGGIAYVYDIDGYFKARCNLEMVKLNKKINEHDSKAIHKLLKNHYKYTESKIAEEILKDFYNATKNFIKVIPMEYEHILNTESKEHLKEWVDSIIE